VSGPGQPQQPIQIPMIAVGKGVFIIVGGFIEVNAADEKAVVLTYVGGSTRTLDTEQSEAFLTGMGLKSRDR
jgi:hypothetical protein